MKLAACARVCEGHMHAIMVNVDDKDIDNETHDDRSCSGPDPTASVSAVIRAVPISRGGGHDAGAPYLS